MNRDDYFRWNPGDLIRVEPETALVKAEPLFAVQNGSWTGTAAQFMECYGAMGNLRPEIAQWLLGMEMDQTLPVRVRIEPDTDKWGTIVVVRTS